MKPTILLLASLMLVAIAFNLIVFPYFALKTSGHQLLDTQFFYKPESAAYLLFVLGHEGRKWYLWMAGLVDMVYPVVYGSVLVILTRWLSANRLLSYFALAAPVADVAENLATIAMLIRYPKFDKSIALLGSFFNGIKWISVAVIILILVVLATRKLFFSSKNHNTDRFNE
jgi:hypothetical protein